MTSFFLGPAGEAPLGRRVSLSGIQNKTTPRLPVLFKKTSAMRRTVGAAFGGVKPEEADWLIISNSLKLLSFFHSPHIFGPPAGLPEYLNI
jgi:hypothetical protein